MLNQSKVSATLLSAFILIVLCRGAVAADEVVSGPKISEDGVNMSMPESCLSLKKSISPIDAKDPSLGSITSYLCDTADYSVMAGNTHFKFTVDQGDTHNRLDTMQDAMIKSYGDAQLVSQQDYLYDGHPARKFMILLSKNNPPLHARTEIVLMGEHAIQVISWAFNKDTLDTPALNNVIQSVHVD